MKKDKPIKPLTKKQKTIQVQREIKSFIKNKLTPKMLSQTERLINDEELEDEFFDSTNDEIKNHVIKCNVKN